MKVPIDFGGLWDQGCWLVFLNTRARPLMEVNSQKGKVETLNTDQSVFGARNEISVGLCSC